MNIKIERNNAAGQIEINVIITDIYLSTCKYNPNVANAIREQGIEDTIGMLSDTLHIMFGCEAPEKKRNQKNDIF